MSTLSKRIISYVVGFIVFAVVYCSLDVRIPLDNVSVVLQWRVLAEGIVCGVTATVIMGLFFTRKK